MADFISKYGIGDTVYMVSDPMISGTVKKVSFSGAITYDVDFSQRLVLQLDQGAVFNPEMDAVIEEERLTLEQKIEDDKLKG